MEIGISPQGGMISEEAGAKLNHLANLPNTKVAILTGRSLTNLKAVLAKAKLKDSIILIGTHGAEAGEEIIESPYLADWEAWSSLFQAEEHLVYEPKALSYAIHYKTHPRREEMRARFWAAYPPFKNKFRVQEGIGVFELMPHNINKGIGIDYLHQHYPDYQLVFFGDDLTDNYAHARINELGMTSYQVGHHLKGADIVAKNIIENVSAVYSYIDSVALRRASHSSQ